MAYKRKVQNKKEKVEVETKKPTAKKIDWDKLPAHITIIGKQSKHLIEGKEYTIGKESAKYLVEKGVATLK